MTGVRDQGQETAYRRDSGTWIAFAALFAFGILNALLGPLLPYLRQSEHTSYLLGSLHQVAFAVGGMTAGVLATRSDAPRRRTIVIGLVIAACAGVLLGYGRVFPLTVLAALLISAFATAALIRIWAMLADLHHRYRAVAMTEGEVAVSLAGIATPALISVCAASAVSWRFSVVVAFVLVLSAAAAVRMTHVPDPTVPAPSCSGGAARGIPHGRRSTLVTIFAVVALEFTLSFWAATYLHDDVGIARDQAVALISALYAANLVGRLLASRLARRMATATVLRLSLVTAFVGVPILLVADNIAVAAIGLAVAGIGIGCTFPLASSLHVAASGRTADQALGQIITVAGIGQIVGPLAVGALAQGVGLRGGLTVLLALVVVAAVSVLRAGSP